MAPPLPTTITTSSSDPTSRWSELTHVCLLDILFRLSIEDRWRSAMLVCKFWFHACKDPFLNSVLDLEPYFFDSSAEMDRWWSPEFERRVDGMVRSVVEWSEGDLREIRVRHASDRALVLVAARCPKLQVLSIKSSMNVTDEAMSKVASGCPMLVELDISYCYEISHESLSLIGRSCSNLKILKRNFMNGLDTSQHRGVVPDGYLNAYPSDPDSEAAAIANTMSHLEHLELRFVNLSSKGLGLIAERCVSLEYLDLYGCAYLTSRDIVNATIKLKNLKTIKKPDFFIPRSVFHSERYGHWQLYDERFQTDVFRI